jgi:putative aldouronate transport system substrate-binding protein
MPDLVNNRALDPYAEDWYYDYVRLLNQEFHKGTILSETFTRDHDQYVATLASGAVLGVFDQEWNFGAARDLLLQEGRIERTFLPIALTWDESIAPHYIDNLSFTANNGFGISVNSRHAERIMKLVDYIIQEDVQKWLSWGIEGEHYSVRNGRYIRSFEQRRRQTDDPQWVRDNMGRWYRDMFPKIDGSFPNGNATGPGGQDEEAWATLPDYDRDLFTKLGISSRIGLMGAPVDVPVWYPFWGKRSFTEGDGTAASIAWENQRWFMIENQPQLVIAPQGQFESRLRTFRDNLARVDVQPALDQLNIDIQNILRMAE